MVVSRRLAAARVAGGLLVLLAVPGLAGCGEPPVTAVVLRLQAESAGADRPFTVALDWLGSGPAGTLFRGRRIPEVGTLRRNGRELETIFIQRGATHPPGPRRALVKGRIDTLFFWGAARTALTEGQVVEVPLVLTLRPFEDGDGDGVPDVLDECPGADDYLGCR